jgi:hypothetical protein
LLGPAGIVWQKKTHYKYFKNPEIYRRFYKILVRVTRYSSIPLSDVMQRKLVLWLRKLQRNRGERKAADRFERYWTGDRRPGPERTVGSEVLTTTVEQQRDRRSVERGEEIHLRDQRIDGR